MSDEVSHDPRGAFAPLRAAFGRTTPQYDEPGLHEDTLEWLDKVAPPSWKEPANDVARELLPDPDDYRHHRGARTTATRI